MATYDQKDRNILFYISRSSVPTISGVRQLRRCHKLQMLSKSWQNTIFSSHSDSVVAALEVFFLWFLDLVWTCFLFSDEKGQLYPFFMNDFGRYILDKFCTWRWLNFLSPPQDPAQIPQCPSRVLCTMVPICIIITLITFYCNGLSQQWNDNGRCPACVNFNPQLERLQAATKNIPLKVVKVSDPTIRIKWSLKY